MDNNRPHYATVQNPSMEAVVNSLYRFKSKKQAIERLDALKEHFTTSSKHRDITDSADSTIMWVKGFQVTKKEEKKGVMGNYALISCQKTKDGRFTLIATKLESDMKYHPQRVRQKQRHPNWGHPVLRGIKKKKIYPDVESAHAELDQLHEEFPDVSIPCTNKTYIIIYSRAAKGESPIQKYVLEIKTAEEGGFYIDYRLNDYKPPLRMPKDDDGKLVEPQGHFTSMLALKRKIRK